MHNFIWISIQAFLQIILILHINTVVICLKTAVSCAQNIPFTAGWTELIKLA